MPLRWTLIGSGVVATVATYNERQILGHRRGVRVLQSTAGPTRTLILIASIFAPPPHMNTDIAAQRAFDRLAKVGFEMLAEHEKILAAVWTFEAQVTNRGFARYFSSSAGDIAFYAPTAFKTIGALRKAEIAARANGVFGAGGPPRDRRARRELVRAFDAKARKSLDALETEFYQSLEDADDLLEVHLNKS